MKKMPFFARLWLALSMAIFGFFALANLIAGIKAGPPLWMQAVIIIAVPSLIIVMIWILDEDMLK